MNEDIIIDLDEVTLMGNISIPEGARKLVIFAHGSGSSRFSPRNRYVAQALNLNGIATLLFDLLTPDEESIDVETRSYRFNIELLAKRLAAVTEWLIKEYDKYQFNIGYFGSSTGAAAALVASTLTEGKNIKAIVSRGGRPDLAGDFLAQVTAATLLIVGELDTEVIELNEETLKYLSAEKAITIVPGATHLFEEPGTLDVVINLAKDWFLRYL